MKPKGMRRSLGGCDLQVPLRNLITRSCFPANLPSKILWFAAIAAMYILHLHLVILQTLLSKATYNWGMHKVINLEEANRGSARNTKSQALFK